MNDQTVKNTIAAPAAPRTTDHIAFRPIGMADAVIAGGPWGKWQDDNRDISIPHALAWTEREGTVDNLRRLAPSAGGLPERRGLWFNDSNLYKALESAAWELGRGDVPAFTSLVADMAAIIGDAQEEDGYVNSFVQAGLDVKWDNLVKSHEQYCIGHLIQAGVAHKRTTGRTELLDVARKAADSVVKDFGDNRRPDFDGHEVIESALIELYRETGEEKYLALAKQFIDNRGHGVLPAKGEFDSAYFQDATPVRDETTTVGHAVRAVYLLAGVLDLYIETGEKVLLDAAIAQWESMTATKTFITGALGSRFIGEAFGDRYELPPDLVYGETCATIGNVMASWRLLLITGQSRFADAIERGMFNLVAASTSIERNAFFYSNPAQRRTERPEAPLDAPLDRSEAPGTRPVWYACSCCPSNITRIIASLGTYVATHNDHGVQVHQFIPSRLSVVLAEGDVEIRMDTTYPLDGTVDIAVERTVPSKWTLSLRKPEWADEVTVLVNGESIDPTVSAGGYIEITRDWTVGDKVVLELPMQPRLTSSHPAADALRGTVVIERGPLVYALESKDQPDLDLDKVELLVGGELSEEHVKDFLGNPTVLVLAHGVIRDDERWSPTTWRNASIPDDTPTLPVMLRAIPYHLWANRGPSTMRVFLPARNAETGS